MSDFILVSLIAMVALCHIVVISMLIIGCCKQLKQRESNIKARQEALKERQEALLARQKYKDLTQHFGENI